MKRQDAREEIAIDRRNEKKTILYIGGFQLPDRNAAAHRVVGIAKGCRKLGYDVVFLNSIKNLNKEKVELKKYFGFKCYEYTRESNIDYLLLAKTVIRYLKIIKPSCVIAYNYPGIALERIRKYCKKHSIKCVADSTEWYKPVTGNMLFRLIKTIDTTYRMKIVQSKLDGVIAISKFLYNYYKDKTQTVQIPPTVDINDKKWHIEKKRDKNKITFIYAGSPSMQKERLDIIVDAVEELNANKEIRFNVVGITEAQFQSIYNRNFVSERIVFWGRVEHKIAIEMTKSSDWAIIIRENNSVVNAGFPTKIVESISCGTPVIFNRFSNVEDYISSKEGVVVEPNNLKTELQKICRCRLEPNNSLFDYHNYINELKGLLEDVK